MRPLTGILPVTLTAKVEKRKETTWNRLGSRGSAALWPRVALFVRCFDHVSISTHSLERLHLKA